MYKFICSAFLFTTSFILQMNITNAQATYTMPSEELQHEGTWLQWPHHYEYGTTYRNRLDATWVAMTKALVASEKVHLIVYDATEKTRVQNLLTAASVATTNIDFFQFPTNDVWVRDNGPIFVRDTSGKLIIQDWGFNGWGGDYNFNLCNPIPTSVANALAMTVVNLNSTMVNEGGAVEMDGNGVLMTTKSAILCQSNPANINAIRNIGMTQAQAETIFQQYLGVSKFIWLDGFYSVDDITDAHIDGFARFANGTHLVTMSTTDLTYWGLSTTDISLLTSATDINNKAYTITQLPLTQNDVTTAYGKNLGYKGSYINYYVANSVVLVPNYSDPNDATANAIIQGLYPTRTVVGIDVRNLYENGGMVHCVTQQQPVATASVGLKNFTSPKNNITISQNPTNDFLKIVSNDELHNAVIKILNANGQLIFEKQNQNGKQFQIDLSKQAAGIYFIEVQSSTNIYRNKIVKE
ncbi:MAG: hypothetical protein RIQ33_745 [Bacteroidota bacterium]|jgi:agmatine deiminase